MKIFNNIIIFLFACLAAGCNSGQTLVEIGPSDLAHPTTDKCYGVFKDLNSTVDTDYSVAYRFSYSDYYAYDAEIKINFAFGVYRDADSSGPRYLYVTEVESGNILRDDFIELTHDQLANLIKAITYSEFFNVTDDEDDLDTNTSCTVFWVGEKLDDKGSKIITRDPRKSLPAKFILNYLEDLSNITKQDEKNAQP